MLFFILPLTSIIKDIKDVMSLITPIVVAIVGWIISRSVQRRNRIEERSASLATQWASDFVLLSKSVNDIATNILFSFWKYTWLDSQGLQDKLQTHIDKMDIDLFEWAILLKRRGYEMEGLLGLSPRNGPALQKSFEALETIVDAWFRNKGGNIDAFRAAQLDFNRCSRSVHEELLQLRDK